MSTQGHLDTASTSQIHNTKSDVTLHANGNNIDTSNPNDNTTSEMLTSRRTSDTLEATSNPHSPEKDINPSLVYDEMNQVSPAVMEKGQVRAIAATDPTHTDAKEADHVHKEEGGGGSGGDENNNNEQAEDDEQNYLSFGPRLMLITVCLMLAVFCMALDNTIISVAIPSISDEFHRLNHVGWYAAAYLLTTCAFQLFFGKLYTVFSVKWVFLIGLSVFELGSLVCAVAPTSVALIFGRAIAGVGSGSLFAGAMIIIAHTVPLSHRPVYMGGLAGVFAIASVAGPLLGGVFTDKVTWRWCFYINLPVGGVTAVGILFLLRLKPSRNAQAKKPWFTIVKDLDPIGTIFFIGCAISLLLALQWGGVEYPWSDGRVIALFVVFGVLLMAFVASQVYNEKYRTVPGRIIGPRSMIGACLYAICSGSAVFIMVYYLPLWFQAIKGTSAVKSGINLLAMLLPQVFGSMASGALVTMIGYYAPFFIISSVLMSIGIGLCTLFTVDTPMSQWIGFQFLVGLGIGLGFQQTAVTAQTVLPLADVPVGTALVILMQIFGGAIFVAVAQNMFTNHLLENILALNIKGLDPAAILGAGATNLRKIVDPSLLPEVLTAYNEALVSAYRVALIMGAISTLGSVLVEWKSVKGKKTGGVVA